MLTEGSVANHSQDLQVRVGLLAITGGGRLCTALLRFEVGTRLAFRVLDVRIGRLHRLVN